MKTLALFVVIALGSLGIAVYFLGSSNREVEKEVNSPQVTAIHDLPLMESETPKVTATQQNKPSEESAFDRLKWQRGDSERAKAIDPTQQKADQHTRAEKVMIVHSIKTKLLVDLGGYVVVSLKGNLSESNSTGSQEIKLQAIDKAGAELGKKHLAVNCSVIKGKQSTFTISIWMPTTIYKKLNKWQGSVVGLPFAEKCNASDLIVNNIVRSGKGINRFGDLVFDLEVHVENQADHVYTEDQRISIQSLDDEGYCLGTFDLAKIVTDTDGGTFLDESALRSLGALSKRKVTFAGLEIHPKMYNNTKRWNIVPWSMGHPHAFLSE